MDAELYELCALLEKEFVEVPRETILAVLRKHDNDVSAARKALYALPAVGSSSGDAPSEKDAALSRSQQHYDAGGSERPSDPLSSWLSGGAGPATPVSPSGGSWSLDDVTTGLSNLGAQLSLGFRQVAHSIGQYLPPELNPFVEEYEYDEEDGPEPTAQELAEQREREGAGEVKAVSATKASEQLHKRGKAGGSARPTPRPSADDEQQGGEEEDWEENEKWD